ncbi:transposase (plasmid) [Burkholderia sp. KK1]|nr:transposase [Burkholderia sp. KK1]
MSRMLLTDEIWKRLESVVPGKAGDVGRHGADNRLFVEAVLWIARRGSPWRDLPKEFGRWHTAYIRFSRWRRKGFWERVALVLAQSGEVEHVLIDSTFIRAHRHSAGARKKAERKRSGDRAED